MLNRRRSLCIRVRKVRKCLLKYALHSHMILRIFQSVSPLPSSQVRRNDYLASSRPQILLRMPPLLVFPSKCNPPQNEYNINDRICVRLNFIMIDQIRKTKTKKIIFPSATFLYLEIEAEAYPKDIIPHEYEGGFTLWECELDLLQFMLSYNFKDISVLQIGCGHGLLGILACKAGAAHTTFQDYNKDVIQHLTKPNVQLNLGQESHLHPIEYVFGDWSQMHGAQFDLVLGSEVIYKEENYQKIVGVLERIMKPNGKCILANKYFYFGVGGNMPCFKQYLMERGYTYQLLKKIQPQMGGNKREIISIWKKQTMTNI